MQGASSETSTVPVGSSEFVESQIVPALKPLRWFQIFKNPCEARSCKHINAERNTRHIDAVPNSGERLQDSVIYIRQTTGGAHISEHLAFFLSKPCLGSYP